jgi:hypothetical protein
MHWVNTNPAITRQNPRSRKITNNRNKLCAKTVKVAQQHSNQHPARVCLRFILAGWLAGWLAGRVHAAGGVAS